MAQSNIKRCEWTSLSWALRILALLVLRASAKGGYSGGYSGGGSYGAVDRHGISTAKENTALFVIARSDTRLSCCPPMTFPTCEHNEE